MTTEPSAGLSETGALLRLQAWFSPAFPVGGFSYSHGLEAALEAGWIGDLDGLVDWLASDLAEGTLRSEAILFLRAHRETGAGDRAALAETAGLAAALRGSAELALESSQQGSAFLATLRAVWPAPALDALVALLAARGLPASLAVAAGAACAAHGIAAEQGLACFLQGTLANLVSAALRLGLLGQTDGQRALARLEPAVAEAVAAALAADPEDLGSAGLLVEIATLVHETQYSRLFRS
ncbi:urease accessory protein [Tistlia consotensis]|uniref:Urease accessory protein UreF n=1 Tax=Tistlia consotensis USBA 355 TaxID=560819 RepID=A0A1Y6BGH9_9PROT|nr:urease accessory UreF family protein [Tistlia consotensis]SMF02514.1 urease accessory protein [Tistlia consotensis USBA 355]SNR52882.1 urease accessory protein [Tistlia consotensis]